MHTVVQVYEQWHVQVNKCTACMNKLKCRGVGKWHAQLCKVYVSKNSDKYIEEAKVFIMSEGL